MTDPGGDPETGGSSKYIKLVSADGTELFLERQIAISTSATLAAMLTGGGPGEGVSFRESEEGVVRFPDISGPVLEEVVRYMHYKVENENSTGRIPEFPIDPEMSLELLVAATCRDLN